MPGAPGVIRTPDLLVRSQLLYPAELRAHAGLLYRDVSVSPTHLETEIKLRAPDAAAAAELLTTHGFILSRPRIHERNSLFDTDSNELRNTGQLLRVREAGELFHLTFKAPVTTAGLHKVREELEIQVSDARLLQQILQRLGYRRTFTYEKYRTEFDDEGRGTAVLDETPIGTFLELEGEPAWIDRSAQRMGFTASDYITASYGRLYLEWCARQGVSPSDMIWPPSPNT